MASRERFRLGGAGRGVGGDHPTCHFRHSETESADGENSGWNQTLLYVSHVSQVRRNTVNHGVPELPTWKHDGEVRVCEPARPGQAPCESPASPLPRTRAMGRALADRRYPERVIASATSRTIGPGPRSTVGVLPRDQAASERNPIHDLPGPALTGLSSLEGTTRAQREARRRPWGWGRGPGSNKKQGSGRADRSTCACAYAPGRGPQNTTNPTRTGGAS